MGASLPDVSRNMLVQHSRPDADAYLWIDDDMNVPPDGLVRLIAHNKPVAAGLFTTRTEPVDYTHREYNPERDLFSGMWISG